MGVGGTRSTPSLGWTGRKELGVSLASDGRSTGSHRLWDSHRFEGVHCRAGARPSPAHGPGPLGLESYFPGSGPRPPGSPCCLPLYPFYS